MTRSREKGENEFTRAAKREALRTGVPVGDIIKRMLDEANDAASRIKIVRAQKFLGKRNPRKRRRRR